MRDRRDFPDVKLISWNVNGRVKGALERQLAAIRERDPDVVALQEVRRESYPAWCERLLADGYAVASTIDLLRVPYPDPEIERRYINLTAARGPVALLPGLSFDEPVRAKVAFPEKYVAARVRLGDLTVDVHNAHLPPGATRGVIKVEAFEAIRRRVDEHAPYPRILCGDFNTPRTEDDVSVTTWTRGDARWDQAERSILEHPSCATSTGRSAAPAIPSRLRTSPAPSRGATTTSTPRPSSRGRGRPLRAG